MIRANKLIYLQGNVHGPGRLASGSRYISQLTAGNRGGGWESQTLLGPGKTVVKRKAHPFSIFFAVWLTQPANDPQRSRAEIPPNNLREKIMIIMESGFRQIGCKKRESAHKGRDSIFDSICSSSTYIPRSLQTTAFEP